MNEWQPQPYDPNLHSRRAQQPPVTPPQWQPQQQPYGYQQPQSNAFPQQPEFRQPRHQAPPPQRRGYGPWIAVGAVAVIAAAGAAVYVSRGSTPSAPAASGSTAQPETEAGVRSAATQFYALYTAGQWAPAWQVLTPSAQHAVPEATYAAVHEGCPSASAGVARVIKSVTMAGSTAVVTETLSGAAGALGSVTDAWSYAGGRWGVALSPSSLADYSHGSAAADVAALKAAGQCAS